MSAHHTLGALETATLSVMYWHSTRKSRESLYWLPHRAPLSTCLRATSQWATAWFVYLWKFFKALSGWIAALGHPGALLLCVSFRTMWQNGSALIPGDQLHRAIPSAIWLWVHSAGGQPSRSVLERDASLPRSRGYCSEWSQSTLLEQNRKWFLISTIRSINNSNSHGVTKQSLCLKYRREVIGPERHYQLECSIFAWFTIFKQFKPLRPINLNAQTALPPQRTSFIFLFL